VSRVAEPEDIAGLVLFLTSDWPTHRQSAQFPHPTVTAF